MSRLLVSVCGRAAVLGALIGVLVAGPGPAHAQSAGGWTDKSNWSGSEHVNTGGYLMIGALTAFEAFQDDGGQDFDNSFGFVLKGGSRFHPLFAAEIEGNFISGFDTLVNISDNPGFPGSNLPPLIGLTVDGGNVTANAVAYLPLGRIQPKAIVGLGGMWARLRSTNQVSVVCGPSYYSFYWYCTGAYAQLASDGGFVMRFGGGVDVQLGEAWALVVDGTYVMPFGSIDELSYVNLNWGVRFDF